MRSLADSTPGYDACAFNREGLAIANPDPAKKPLRVPAHMVCGHACEGPALMIHAQMLLRNVLNVALHSTRSALF